MATKLLRALCVQTPLTSNPGYTNDRTNATEFGERQRESTITGKFHKANKKYGVSYILYI